MKDKKTPYPVSTIVPLFILLLGCIPFAAAAAPIIFAETPTLKLISILIAPVSFSLVFLAISCLLSMPFQKAIVAGKFPRDITHFVYGPRRLYGLAWGALFYFTPLYFAVTSIPTLRKIIFRGFGYKGDLDVNIAPDAWIRDLPVLKLGKGVYVANKSTMGTNMCLSDGSILVDEIVLGPKAMVGHMAKVGPGAKIGEGGEVAVDSAIGIRTRLGSMAKVAPACLINHGATLGDGAEIGTMSYVGVKAIIANGVKVPPGSNIGDGLEIKDPSDLLDSGVAEERALGGNAEKLKGIYSNRAKLYSLHRANDK